MTLHHKKHHQTYVNGLNAAEEAYAKTSSAKERIALQAALKFNGGGMSCHPTLNVVGSLICSTGHINHSLFWKNMAPSAKAGKGVGGQLNHGPLKQAIDRDFGSLEGLIKAMNAACAGIQGSGWGWLVSVDVCLLSTHFRPITNCRVTTPRPISLRSPPPPIKTLFSVRFLTHSPVPRSLMLSSRRSCPSHRHRYVGACFLHPVQERQARCKLYSPFPAIVSLMIVPSTSLPFGTSSTSRRLRSVLLRPPSPSSKCESLWPCCYA